MLRFPYQIWRNPDTGGGGGGDGFVFGDPAADVPPAEGADSVAHYKKLWMDLKKSANDSYQGLQRKLTTAQGQYTALQTELNQKNDALTARIKEVNDLTAAQTTVQTNLETANATIQGMTPKLTDLESYKARTSLLIEKYPQLIQFEKDGLLPTADTQEELDTKWAAFAERIKTLAGNNSDGSTPPPPGGDNQEGSSEQTLKEYYRQMAAASSQQKWDEVSRINGLIQKELSGGGAKK